MIFNLKFRPSFVWGVAVCSAFINFLHIWRQEPKIVINSFHNKDGEPLVCLPAPYLYITYHGKPNNIRKFSRDGCDLGDVLIPINDTNHQILRELRGMLMYNVTNPTTGLLEEHLFVISAHKGQSKILAYGKCDPDQGFQRPFLGVLFEEGGNSMLEHPYAITVGPLHHFYVSVQDTSTVLRYHLDGVPSALPMALRYDTTNKYYPGAFIVFPKHEDVRGLAFDKEGVLYVANKQEGVVLYDLDGFKLGSFEMPAPIGLTYDARNNFLYAGSDAGVDSQIYEWDLSKGTIHRKLGKEDKALVHPAGLITYKDSLYVISQDVDSILVYNLLTGNYKRTIYHGFPTAGEQLVLSEC